jgi:hypothetical protein
VQTAGKLPPRQDPLFWIANFDLAAVCVSAQRQVNAVPHRRPKDKRIVCEEQLHLIRERTLECCGEIGLSDHVVVDAGEPERAAAGLESKAFVDEHPDTDFREFLNYQIGVRPMVVVPKAGICSELRLESAQDSCDRCDVFLLVRNIITRQQEHVRPEPVRDLDRPFDMFEVGERAVMDIGQVNDLKSVKLLWKTLEPDLDPFQRETRRFVHRNFRYFGDVSGKLAKRLFAADEGIDTLRNASFSLPGRFHFSFE